MTTIDNLAHTTGRPPADHSGETVLARLGPPFTTTPGGRWFRGARRGGGGGGLFQRARLAMSPNPLATASGFIVFTVRW